MITKEIAVTQWVQVTIDETKFTPEFLAEFDQYVFKFGTDSEAIDRHFKHLAQLYTRGIYDDYSFIEGYGQAEDMGIKFDLIDQTERIEP
jgi:hypothetical protein